MIQLRLGFQAGKEVGLPRSEVFRWRSLYPDGVENGSPSKRTPYTIPRFRPGSWSPKVVTDDVGSRRCIWLGQP